MPTQEAVEEDMTTILTYSGAGAHGFVIANGSIQGLVESIERAVVGKARFSPRLAAQLLRQRPIRGSSGHPCR
jgi:DNA-binding NarL/FixJ family response regulator